MLCKERNRSLGVDSYRVSVDRSIGELEAIVSKLCGCSMLHEPPSDDAGVQRDLETGAVAEILHRLRRIESRLEFLASSPTTKDRYSVEEVAEIVCKAPFTVREWCRNGRIRAEKRACGRGRTQEWSITREEIERVQNDGLLPIEGFVYRYRGM